MNIQGRGMWVAGAAASLLLTGAVAAQAADEKAGGDEVMCSGINACKGKGACAGATSACAGKNACKGKGVVKATAAECTAQGGTVAPEPEMK